MLKMLPPTGVVSITSVMVIYMLNMSNRTSVTGKYISNFYVVMHPAPLDLAPDLCCKMKSNSFPWCTAHRSGTGAGVKDNNLLVLPDTLEASSACRGVFPVPGARILLH